MWRIPAELVTIVSSYGRGGKNYFHLMSWQPDVFHLCFFLAPMQHFATLSSASALTRCLVATGSRPSRRRRDRSSSRIQSEPRGLPAETRPRSTPRSQDIKIVQNSRKLGSVLIIWKSASRFDHLALERVDSINIKMLCGFSVRLISGLGPSTSRSSPWTPHRGEWDSVNSDGDLLLFSAFRSRDRMYL